MVETLIVLTLVLMAAAYFGSRLLGAVRAARRTTADGCGGDCCGKD